MHILLFKQYRFYNSTLSNRDGISNKTLLYRSTVGRWCITRQNSLYTPFTKKIMCSVYLHSSTCPSSRMHKIKKANCLHMIQYSYPGIVCNSFHNIQRSKSLKESSIKVFFRKPASTKYLLRVDKVTETKDEHVCKHWYSHFSTAGYWKTCVGNLWR